jgi:hypothetical protein
MLWLSPISEASERCGYRSSETQAEDLGADKVESGVSYHSAPAVLGAVDALFAFLRAASKGNSLSKSSHLVEDFASTTNGQADPYRCRRSPP